MSYDYELDEELGLIDDLPDEPTTREEYVSRCLGPQQIGGRYHCGYWNQDYRVIAIDHGDDDRWWSITVQWDNNRTTNHCTAWDEDNDRVISQPE
ncbi:hypothetical protein [Streptomyces sp. XH2]|uniref:hypothetical protein n=1 Tax=Streptomyces sp. XH2 TaxID=3412483 RepID=UPI003C7C33D1